MVARMKSTVGTAALEKLLELVDPYTMTWQRRCSKLRSVNISTRRQPLANW